MAIGDEISWQVMRQIVQRWAGREDDLAEAANLSGGCISTALALTLRSGRRAVLKISPHRVDRSYADEAVQLALLRDAGLPVPDVYHVQTGSLDEPFSYILMEYVEGVDLATARRRCSAEQFEHIQEKLAELLLTLHRQTDNAYRRVCCSDAPLYSAWPACYRDLYSPVWKELEGSKLIPVKARKVIGRLHDRLERYIGHDDCPRLLHGDLWATNVLARPDADHGRWTIACVLDPNCKFAHVESEIAYLELFRTVTPTFLRRYQQEHRLPSEYHRLRKPIYQLYSLLNHVRLFGEQYVRSVCQAVERVASFV